MITVITNYHYHDNDRSESLNIRELSKIMNMSYSTTWKYVKLLNDHKLITLERDNGKVKIITEHVNTFKRFVELLNSGYNLQNALIKLKEGFSEGDNEVIQYIQRLEKRIIELEKENRNLSQLLQVYLSKIDSIEDQIKALPKPKKSIWERIKGLFEPSE